MELNLRKIKDSDMLFLKMVYRSTREDEMEPTGWTEEQKSGFIDFQFNAQHAYYLNVYKDALFRIIEVKKTDIGRLYTWETEKQIRIVDIAILPEFRGKGIGTKILSDLIQQSESSGKSLSIHVEGFKKTDDTGVYLFMERLPKKA
jgi:GNAT superfamily N-acetyltransferase